MLKRGIGALIKKAFKKLGYKIITIDYDNYNYKIISQLDRYGHYSSYSTKSPVNKAGQPIPWFTYPAIEYIDQLDLSGSDILEWGCGASSEYFQNKVKKITSIEHNKNWYMKTKDSFKGGNKIILADECVYVTAAYGLRKKFDLIIVDGILRAECMMAAKELIKDDGFIILDNSDRHPDLCEFMRRSSFLQVDMHGIGPVNDYGWTTTLFFNKNSSPVPISRQPQIPIGGGF